MTAFPPHIQYVGRNGNNCWINPSNIHLHVSLGSVQYRAIFCFTALNKHLHWPSLMAYVPAADVHLLLEVRRRLGIDHTPCLIIRHQQVQLRKREFLHMGIIFGERSLPKTLSANDAWLCPFPSEFPWS